MRKSEFDEIFKKYEKNEENSLKNNAFKQNLSKTIKNLEEKNNIIA